MLGDLLHGIKFWLHEAGNASHQLHGNIFVAPVAAKHKMHHKVGDPGLVDADKIPIKQALVSCDCYGMSADVTNAWEELHKANIALANAHHTSRNVPHPGTLALAINEARWAEQNLLPWSSPDNNWRLIMHGPPSEINHPEASSPIIAS